MKCPHCEYKDGWDQETTTTINGDKGEFFELPIEMTRIDHDSYWQNEQKRNLCACPSCGKSFIEIY